MKPIYDINDRIFRRLIIITIVLVIIGFILFTYIFTRQRLEILHKQYQVVETYSGSIVDNVSDAIIVYNNDEGIMICNDAAASLFSKNKSDVLQKSPQVLFADEGCRKIIETEFENEQVVCNIVNRKRYLFISKSQFYDSKEIINTILVIRDLTEQKNLEEKMARKQRLTAMGELASGVAHEIRNPLNAIGTIVQQLNKDFEVKNEQNEYHELLKIVYSEVNRINDTISEFLRFARPEPLSVGEFKLDDLMNELGVQYKKLLNEKMITLVINNNLEKRVVWDKNQIKQVLINILLNAVDAIGENGKIIITSELASNGDVLIRIEDDGAGMPNNVVENIFNLYYTTKAKGTGIGLSIVQRIIYEHHGLITVDSEDGKGTVFNINIPVSLV
jgi:signal transduction histidine kinase